MKVVQLCTILIFASLLLVCEIRMEDSALNKTCGPNENYLLCGATPGCAPYCNQDKQEKQLCIAMCHPGCNCMKGYLREAVDSTLCVLEDKCKRQPECGKHEVYKTCQLDCPKSCENREDKKCFERCVTGCFCKDKYIKLYNSKRSQCIRESACPV